MKRKASVSHDETIMRRPRKDPILPRNTKAALEYDDETRVLLIALRHLAQAQGIAKVAKAAGIERESLYRALSEHGILASPLRAHNPKVVSSNLTPATNL